MMHPNITDIAHTCKRMGPYRAFSVCKDEGKLDRAMQISGTLAIGKTKQGFFYGPPSAFIESDILFRYYYLNGRYWSNAL